MRNLIDLIILTERSSQVDELKALLAKQIKQLPDDDTTAKALKEIEDLLQHVGQGGRMGIINANLAAINDPSVTAAQKDLARYILSLDMTPDQRNELFTLWKGDKLIKTSELLKIGKHSFSEIVAGYDTNPAIQELTNQLMRISALGQGKGEFGLSVMSKSISKPKKGDLLIAGHKIEVKTTDGGAGRFTDQEVRPGKGFENAARALNSYLESHSAGLPRSGVNLRSLTDYVGWLKDDPKAQAELLKLTEEVISIIFNGADVSSIMEALKVGNANGAAQEYAKVNFDYYMSKKDDEGVLYIDLTKDPIQFIFFKQADDLAAAGLRFHSDAAYVTSIADVRLPYPQITIVPTTGGADAEARSSKAYADSQAKSARQQAIAAKKLNPHTGIRPPGAVQAPKASPAPGINRERRS